MDLMLKFESSSPSPLTRDVDDRSEVRDGFDAQIRKLKPLPSHEGCRLASISFDKENAKGMRRYIARTSHDESRDSFSLSLS
jgi:hypothetical protein